MDVNVSGGATPYKYKWSNGSINQDLEGLVAGAYTVTVTDNNGCTGTNSFTVATTQISIVNQGCIQITMCGSEVVKVQQFDPSLQFDADCRYARVVCANGYVGPLQYLGFTVEYPAGPSGCVARLRCLNGQIYDQYVGQSVVFSDGGIDACGIPYCTKKRGCYYQSLNIIDAASVVELGPGEIGQYVSPCDVFCDWATFCGYSNGGKTRAADFYCDGSYIGTGCVWACVSPLSLQPSRGDSIVLVNGIELKYPPEVKTLEQAIREMEENKKAVNHPYKVVMEDSRPKLFNVSPNPFFDKLNIELFSEKEKEVNFALMDINGKTILQKTFRALEGGNQLVLDVEVQLPSGSYFLLLTDETGETDARLMIKAH